MMLPTEPAVDTTATAAQVWHRLGAAIEPAHLPAPSSISAFPELHLVLIWLHDHSRTDLYTWVAWLGAHQVWHRSGSARFTSDWRGWTVDVVLIERWTDTATDTGRAA